jgi:hypothetical protein
MENWSGAVTTCFNGADCVNLVCDYSVVLRLTRCSLTCNCADATIDATKDTGTYEYWYILMTSAYPYQLMTQPIIPSII